MSSPPTSTPSFSQGHDLTHVTFAVTCEARLGEQVYLLGDSNVLGNFSQRHAVPLQTSPTAYPRWSTAHGLLLPTGVPVVFKLALYAGGEFSCFEAIDGQRQVVPTGRRQHVELVFNENPKTSPPTLSSSKGSNENDPKDVEVEQTTLFGGDDAVQPLIDARTLLRDEREDVESLNISRRERVPSLHTLKPVTEQLPLISEKSNGRLFLVSCFLPVDIVLMVPPKTSSQQQPSNSSSSSSWHVRWQRGNIVARNEKCPAVRPTDGAAFMARLSTLPKAEQMKMFAQVEAEVNKDGKSWAHSRASPSVADEVETSWVGLVSKRLIRVYERDPNSSSTLLPWSLQSKGTFSPFPQDTNLSLEDKETIASLLREMHCEPIWLSEFSDPPTEEGASALEEAFYGGFCQQVLWPGLHNVLRICGPRWDINQAIDSRRMQSWWSAYQTVNRAFANSIVKLSQSTADVVWLHNYELMLVPGMFREVMETKTTFSRVPAIVFYFHTAFPTSEIFRSLAQRETLLDGVLGADLCGFHSFGYARHFINTCKRLLGTTSQIRQGGRLVIKHQHMKKKKEKIHHSIGVTIAHVGVDKGLIAWRLAQPHVVLAAAAIRKKHKGRRIIASVDDCQRLRGIPLKLLAFHTLLQDCPRLRENVVFIQRCDRPMRDQEEILSTGESNTHLKNENPYYPPIQATKVGKQTMGYSGRNRDTRRSAKELRHLSQWIADSFTDKVIDLNLDDDMGRGPKHVGPDIGASTRDNKGSMPFEERAPLPFVAAHERLFNSEPSFSLNLDARLALWAASDVFFSTPVCSEPLNLYPLEFMAVHELLSRRASVYTSTAENRAESSPIVQAVANAEAILFADGRCGPSYEGGSAVLSEFSTSSEVLNGAIMVNPYDVPQVSAALFAALPSVDDDPLPAPASKPSQQGNFRLRRKSKSRYRRIYTTRISDNQAESIGRTGSSWSKRVLTDLRDLEGGRVSTRVAQDLIGNSAIAPLPPTAPIDAGTKVNAIFPQRRIRSVTQKAILNQGSSKKLLSSSTFGEVDVDMERRTKTNHQNADKSTAKGHSCVAEHAASARIAEAFAISKRRLIILDYGGTLVERERASQYVKREFAGVSMREMAPSTLDALHELAADEKNEVYVISGVDRERLEARLEPGEGKVLRSHRLGMFANGGFSVSNPTFKDEKLEDISPSSSSSSSSEASPRAKYVSNRSSRVWRDQLSSVLTVKGGKRQAWQVIALSIMKQFLWRVNGARVSEKSTKDVNGNVTVHAIVYDYRRADPEWGAAQADSLVELLGVRFSEVDGLGVQIVRLSGQVLVQPEDLGKGSVVSRLLRQYEESQLCTNSSIRTKAFDFVLIVGDDDADEEMFEALLQYVAHGRERGEKKNQSNSKTQLRQCAISLDDPWLFTCTVGAKATSASLYVDDPADVGELLARMAAADRRKKNKT